MCIFTFFFAFCLLPRGFQLIFQRTVIQDVIFSDAYQMYVLDILYTQTLQILSTHVCLMYT